MGMLKDIAVISLDWRMSHATPGQNVRAKAINTPANDKARARFFSEWNSPRYAYVLAAIPETLQGINYQLKLYHR